MVSSTCINVVTTVSSLLLLVARPSEGFQLSPSRASQRHTILPITSRTALLYETEISAKEALKRTAFHLQKLQNESRRTRNSHQTVTDSGANDHAAERDSMYKEYVQQSANVLKDELKKIGLPRTGRKPDLATRLVDYNMKKLYSVMSEEEEAVEQVDTPWKDKTPGLPLQEFAGIALSAAAGQALGNADFGEPSPIQAAAIPNLARGESAILHAQTGSGKTLAYLLPITEQLWKDQGNDNPGYAVIMTPTRELAAQVAGIAQVLAPPGAVRLIFRPTNLLEESAKERGQDEYGAYLEEKSGSRAKPRLFIGSAKGIMHSLYGDGKMPASPTSKPEAMFFLRNVRWVVLDEVDRILHVKKSRGEDRFKQHEKPAAVVTSAITRLTLGRAQIIAASATVGRPLKRELSRVLGLSSQDCPIVIQGSELDTVSQQEKDGEKRRTVSIPSVVSHYVTPVKDSSSGRLLTSSFEVIKELAKKPRKMLLVLTKGLGLSPKSAIGALKHFQCKPEPISLLDALDADGTSHLIQLHQQVSGATGIGESSYFRTGESESEGEYLFVCGEDTVRGLHLDGLDVVIVVGRPNGPDEYTHIAGRTGRAGRSGSVINVVSNENAGSLKSWEHMLEVEFDRLDIKDISNLP